MFVYPSLYEGFGLPIIEAMASGVPVVTSAVTSLPEVAGDAACFVDPMDEQAIAEGICQVANDQAWQRNMIHRGFCRASQFQWDQAAEATWLVLEQAAGS